MTAVVLMCLSLFTFLLFRGAHGLSVAPVPLCDPFPLRWNIPKTLFLKNRHRDKIHVIVHTCCITQNIIVVSSLFLGGFKDRGCHFVNCQERNISKELGPQSVAVKKL